MGGIGSALAKETSSWLDSSCTRSFSMERVFHRMRSRSASLSAMVLWSKDPPVVISSYRADSLLRSNKKCCNNGLV
jgi:hypothetical protein